MTVIGDAISTAQAIAEGETSVREVVEAAIARIEKHHNALNAVVATRFEQALAEVDAGLPAGPLHGVPVLIKDLGTAVAGLPATRGSRLFAETCADRDSEVVARYGRAGMVVLGTTNTPELGKSVSTEPALFGAAHNPWDLSRSTGGSSGGSAAAVAAGLVPVAHGTDGGGSIRIPAAMCGLFGLKPSRGRISPAPYPSTLAGPVTAHHALTTTVRDSALLLDIASGPVPGEAFSAPAPQFSFLEAAGRDPGRLRIGVATSVRGGPTTDPVCIGAVERAAELCERLGHQVDEVTLDFDATRVGRASGTIMGADLVATVEARLSELGRELREDDLEPFTRTMLEHYRSLSGADVIRALQDAQAQGWQVGRVFSDHDAVLTPTLTRPTPELGLVDTSRPEVMYELGAAFSAWTSILNVTGMPGMSVPFGQDDAGMPLGVQFIADLGGEALLLSLAAQLEQAAPWPLRAPGWPE